MNVAPRFSTPLDDLDERRPLRAEALPRAGERAFPAMLADGLAAAEAIAAGGEVRRSSFKRKIALFNILALMLFGGAILFLSSFRAGLEEERRLALTREVELIAALIESNHLVRGGAGPAPSLTGLSVAPGNHVYLFAEDGTLLAARSADPPSEAPVSARITDVLQSVWEGIFGLFGFVAEGVEPADLQGLAHEAAVTAALTSGTFTQLHREADGALFIAAAPVRQGARVVASLALIASARDLDERVRQEREGILRLFLVTVIVTTGFSLLLAASISHPLADLAAAAETGREGEAGRLGPGRVRIPDLAARPDEIGRLSVAMRGMVAALYDRIDANEQFAADVAHEIKNPLASLRSAVGSLRLIRKEEQREKLLDVIEHDVRRLDRLLSDISNASRLDSELVKEADEEFDLSKAIRNLSEYFARQAEEKGIDFILDLPREPILLRGLEARLAQVFVNLLSNAISFCEEGDAVRIWARRKERRILVVVEDTGPGIPEQSLGNIFKRFYSDRPPHHFGNNSGLGLSISKQIVEAHGGVIWAENIRPTAADVTSEPLGARFVVGLPV